MVQGLLGSNASHILSPLSSTLQVVWNRVPVCTMGQHYCDIHEIFSHMMRLDKLIVCNFSPLPSVLTHGGDY